MEPQLTPRVQALEGRMAPLDPLPDRMTALEERSSSLETELHKLRAEMHAEFAAVRAEMRAEFAAVRAEVREGDEETRRYMRVLHEDVIGRLKTLADGLNGTRRRGTRR